jgi:TPR repeat protein
MSQDPLQKYLIRKNGRLTELQSTDLTVFSEVSEAADKLLNKFKSAAKAGDSFAATVCASIFRSKQPQFQPDLLAKFESAARDGDPFALQMCTTINRSKYSTSTDNSLSFEFAKLAAQSNFPPGLAELGYCYEDGRGTEKNLDLALTHLQQSAHLGYATAASFLAIRYAAGQPYGFSPKKAIEYATMAYDLGDAYAAHLLGSWYEDGVIADKNVLLARSWYDKAARQGSGLGCIRMATAYTLGELELPRDLRKASEYHQLVDEMNSA